MTAAEVDGRVTGLRRRTEVLVVVCSVNYVIVFSA